MQFCRGTLIDRLSHGHACTSIDPLTPRALVGLRQHMDSGAAGSGQQPHRQRQQHRRRQRPLRLGAGQLHEQPMGAGVAGCRAGEGQQHMPGEPGVPPARDWRCQLPETKSGSSPLHTQDFNLSSPRSDTLHLINHVPHAATLLPMLSLYRTCSGCVSSSMHIIAWHPSPV